MFTLWLTMIFSPATAEPVAESGWLPAEPLAVDDRDRGKETGAGNKGQPAKAGNNQKSGNNKDNKDNKQNNKQGNNKKAKEPEWEGEWYFEPSAGASVYSSGGTAVTAASIGGQAGYKYRLVNTPDPLWSGKTRVAGSYQTNSNGLQGLDVRVGSFIGPSWDDFGLSIGPDLFWNQALGGGVNLEPTTGLEIPLSANYRAKPLTLSAGVSPAWLSNEARRVDWDTTESALPGFGHEFTYRAGLGLNIEGFNVSAGYSYRIVASGIQQGFSFGVRL